jgi:hypothetical protein
MAEVPRVRTPITETDLALALRAGHVIACGGLPSPSRWACLWAQTALEHGRGKALDCYCLGNVTAAPSWPGDHYTLDCNERIKRNPDVWKMIHLWFRAFVDPAPGAASYVRLLSGRYARALAKMDQGDPAGAAFMLSTLNYYTADEGNYSRAMVSLEQRAREVILPPLATTAETAVACFAPDCDGELRSLLTADEIAEVVAQGAAMAWDVVGDELDADRIRRRGEDPGA